MNIETTDERGMKKMKKEYISPTTETLTTAAPQLLYYTKGLVKVEYSNEMTDQEAVQSDTPLADDAYPALGNNFVGDWDGE